MPRRRLSQRQLKRERRREPPPRLAALPPLPTRSECRSGPRPCPHVRCRYHLMTDVSPKGGLTLTKADGDVEAMAVTCALDLAEHGRMSLEQIAELLDVTRERIRQIEERALARLREALVASGIGAQDVHEHLGRSSEWLSKVAASPCDSGEAELPHVQSSTLSPGRVALQTRFPLERQDKPPATRAESSLRAALGLKKGDASWLVEEKLSDWMTAVERL